MIRNIRNNKRKPFDENAQMLLIETILFAGMVLFSLIFLYQLSPPSTIPTQTTSLKEMGDNALYILYTTPLTESEYLSEDYPVGYIPNKLAHYIHSDNYASLVNDLNNLLPGNVLYNVYLKDTNITVPIIARDLSYFKKFGVLPTSRDVTISNCIITLDSDIGSNIQKTRFPDSSCTFIVLLEMWFV